MPATGGGADSAAAVEAGHRNDDADRCHGEAERHDLPQRNLRQILACNRHADDEGRPERHEAHAADGDGEHVAALILVGVAAENRREDREDPDLEDGADQQRTDDDTAVAPFWVERAKQFPGCGDFGP